MRFVMPLKPCPKCRSVKWVPTVRELGDWDLYYVQCGSPSCGHKGPTRGVGYAQQAWNEAAEKLEERDGSG